MHDGLFVRQVALRVLAHRRQGSRALRSRLTSGVLRILSVVAPTLGVGCAAAPPREVDRATEVSLGAPSASGAAVRPLAPPPTGGDSPAGREAMPIAWERDERDARARAERAGLPLLVFLRADWSVASVELERGVFTDARVARQMRGVVGLRVDLTDASANDELVFERYRVGQLPSVVVYDVHGAEVDRFEGLADVERVLAAIERAYE